jgi:alpha-tubulin suppressor-like RCC1 family protein
MVTFLWRVNGKPTMTTENPFTDVDVSKWFGQAVLWASQRQVTTNEGTFNPGNNVTRAQMAGFLFRSANFTDANEPAEDVTVIDEGELIAVGEAQPDQSAEFEDPGGGLQVGKLFVTVLPNGLPYYGRVIRRSDTTITSEPVTLRDIVPVLDVSVSANPNTGQLQTVSPDVRISDHLLVVPQNSSGSATAQCQGSITAQVSAEYRAAISSFDLDIDWGWSRVSAVSVVFTPDFAVTARSSLTASGTCSYAGELFSIQLPNISFTVGPIPVVITQSLIADVRGTFTVSREASIEVGAVAGMRLGVEYRNGRFNTIADSFLDRQMDSDLTSLVSADVELPIYYNPQAIGLADLRIGIAGEAELQIDPAKRPYLTLDGVLSGQVATTILGKEYTPQRAEFVRKRLWQLGEPVTAPVSLGWDHSCAIVSGRSVKCWGGNYWSQLGDGTQTDRLRPVAVSGLSAATAIAAGRYHTCALVAGGAVKCWGANFDGELGDGTEWSRSTPVTVSGITGATAIAAGAHHTCAIVDGGAVWCWGRNSEGQLGDGTTTGRLAPVRVSLLSGATAIAAGQYHTCAIVPSNVAYCWGNNAGGQLGDGTRTTRLTPVPVIVLGGAIALAAGEGHTCALVADGTLKCWGWNAFGQLGDGTKTDRLTPVTVSGLAGATAISEGERHTCALVAGGTVNCWGSNVGGQLGDGTMTDRLRPKSVSGLTGATAIAAGDDHTCALVPIGSVKCWGDNIYGGLGDGTATDRLTPVTVQGL